MSLISRLLTTLALSPLFLFAGVTETWLGPTLPNGVPCNPTAAGCIIGDPGQFSMVSASLTSPMTAGGKWNLTIFTYYGPQGFVIPSGATSVPTYSYSDGTFNGIFGMADFMIQSGSEYYGIVMSNRTGATAGNLYKGTGFRTSGQVMAPVASPRPNSPAQLDNPTLLGAGSMTITGTTVANPFLAPADANNSKFGPSLTLYKISVDFAAPVTFLNSGRFTIYSASYVCDNGMIVGVGDSFPPPPADTQVPEPTSLLLVIPALGAMAMRYRRN